MSEPVDDLDVYPRRAARLRIDGDRFEARVHARGYVYVGPCVGDWLSQFRRWVERDGYHLDESPVT